MPDSQVHDGLNPPAGPIAGSRWTPSGVAQRFRASFRSANLVGDDSYLARYHKVQWCLNLWRFLVPPQLLLLIWAAPDRVGDINRAYGIFVFLLLYTAIYAFLATRTRAGGSLLFHTADLLIIAGLFFFCDSSTVLFNMVFYAEAVLLGRPSINLKEMAPRVLVLSAAYLIADNTVIASSSPIDYQMVDAALFFIWGLGFLGFSNILERVSSLELDERLDQHRRSYLRRLHDDLGNTLCGLHYKIQSLRVCHDGERLRDALNYINDGYRRASDVILRLLGGLDAPDEELEKSLHDLVSDLLLNNGDLEFELSLDQTRVSLSSEVQSEIFRIIREAVMNAIQHAQAHTIRISSGYRQGRLHFTVADDGHGFNPDASHPQPVTPVSFGLKGMHERAAGIGAKLAVTSLSGAGTRVTLELGARKKGGFLSRVLNFENMGAKGGLYPFLVRMMLFVLLVNLIQAVSQLFSDRASPALLVLTCLMTVEVLAWVIFQNRVHALLIHRPWLLIFHQLYFACMFAAAWRFDVDIFFDFSFNMSVIMSAYFLGIRNNVTLASLGGLMVLLANGVVPATLEGHSYRMEIIIANIASNIVFALTAGLAVEFVKNLEELQSGVVSRALARQRQRLSSVTHRELSELVERLGGDIKKLGSLTEISRLEPETIRRFEKRSAEAKQRLRKMLRSLDDPLTTGAAREREAG